MTSPLISVKRCVDKQGTVCQCFWQSFKEQPRPSRLLGLIFMNFTFYPDVRMYFLLIESADFAPPSLNLVPRAFWVFFKMVGHSTHCARRSRAGKEPEDGLHFFRYWWIDYLGHGKQVCTEYILVLLIFAFNIFRQIEWPERGEDNSQMWRCVKLTSNAECHELKLCCFPEGRLLVGEF